jgi:Ca-activated chloride channel homolog
MKFALIFLLAFSFPVFSQSGRIKPTETPAPRPPAQSTPVPITPPSRERVAAPSPTPSFTETDDILRVESLLIPIPVSVLDRSGNAVRTLRQEDFELKIDGEPAKIGDITRAQIPIRMAILFDNSGSLTTARDFQIEAAVRFIDRVLIPERDQAAIYSVSTSTRLIQPFTPDKNLLVRTLRGLPPPVGATALMDGIELAAKYLSEVQGRRVIVIISDGDDTKTDTTYERALRTAQQNNCQIYIVQTLAFENFIRTGSRHGNANIRSLAAERRMEGFASQTGGAVYMPIDQAELDDAFRRLSADLAEQYIISYYPENDPGSPGEFRPIEVTVRNRTDLTIRARRGYYVPRK